MPFLALVINPDELELRQLVRVLEGEEFSVDTAMRSVEGLLRTLESSPDLIVLAEHIPPLEAEELLTTLRRLSRAQIIIIGSGGDPEEIHALETGADAYLRRPFSQSVLIARAKALLRRYEANGAASDMLLQRIVSALPLSNTERRLLVCLLAHNGKAVSSGQLLLEVWGGSASYEALKFYLSRLRRKLVTAPAPIQLVSVRGMGHRMVLARDERPNISGSRAG